MTQTSRRAFPPNQAIIREKDMLLRKYSFVEKKYLEHEVEYEVIL